VLTLLKAVLVFFCTLIAACLAGFLYGSVAHFFDLFFIFPFIVAGAIVGMGAGAARWLKLRSRPLLIVIGLLAALVAYPCYLAGKYSMLVVAQQLATTPELGAFFQSSLHVLSQSLISPDQLKPLLAQTDARLVSEVGHGGLLGILFQNLQTGIPIRTSIIGRDNLWFGAAIELFKFGVLIVVCTTSLPDTVRAEALYRTGGKRPPAVKRELNALEEELWGKGE
jgi:hypothetical protein